jgi:tetratricopeptide (TPR) repeat protein
VGARPALARAYGQKAIVHMVSEEAEDCLAWSQPTLEMAEELGLDDLRVRMRQARGLARRMLGDLGGVEDLREALRLGHELGLGIEVGTSYANLADALRFIEGPLASLEVSEAGVEFSERRGLMHNVTWLKTERLWSLFDLGRWDELLQIADEVIAWDEAYGGSQIEVIAREARAVVYLCRGELARAAALEEVFLPRSRSIRDAQVLAPALAIGAAIEQAQGNHPAGVRLIEELAVLTADKPVSRAGVLPTAVRVCAAAGALDLGERLLAAAAKVETRDRCSVLTGRALIAEARRELETAAGLYAEAAQRWAEYGHVLEHGLAHLGAGRCLARLGRSAESTVELKEARSVFVRLGARLLVEEVDAEREGAP